MTQRPPTRSGGDASWTELNDRIVSCAACPRLLVHCRQIAQEKRKAYLAWDYWGQPVPNFGDAAARLLIVGLAPAAHGANRTGRMFTGDRSGEWLYRALHRAGFANQPEAISSDDGLQLIDCAITAACHCAPPDNKPTNEELQNCRGWLELTIAQLRPRVLIALGQIAWKAILSYEYSAGGQRPRGVKFAHGAEVQFDDTRWLIGSYHPSQQNTFTGRLTEPMFDAVFCRARALLA